MLWIDLLIRLIQADGCSGIRFQRSRLFDAEWRSSNGEGRRDRIFEMVVEEVASYKRIDETFVRPDQYVIIQNLRLWYIDPNA